MLRKSFVLFVVVSLFVAGGCNLFSKPNDYSVQEPVNDVEAVEPSEPQVEVSNIPETDIIAKVGNFVITKQDLADSIDVLEQQLGQKIERDKITRQQKEMLADLLVRQKLLYLAAKNEGLASDPKVKRALQLAKEQVLSQALLSRYAERINPTDAELQSFYEDGTYQGYKVKDYFTEQEKRRIQEIALDSEAEAKQVLVDIMQGNITFRSAARKYSILKSADKGGDIGYKSAQELYQDGKPDKYVNMAFMMLDKGDVSTVFKADGKYYIIKVAGVRPKQEKPFSEVNDQVESLYKMKKLQEMQNAAIESVKNSGIEVKKSYENL